MVGRAYTCGIRVFRRHPDWNETQSQYVHLRCADSRSGQGEKADVVLGKRGDVPIQGTACELRVLDGYGLCRLGMRLMTDRERRIGYSHAELATALLVLRDVFSVLDEKDKDRAREKFVRAPAVCGSLQQTLGPTRTQKITGLLSYLSLSLSSEVLQMHPDL